MTSRPRSPITTGYVPLIDSPYHSVSPVGPRRSAAWILHIEESGKRYGDFRGASRGPITPRAQIVMKRPGQASVLFLTNSGQTRGTTMAAPSATEQIHDEVRELIRRRGIDPVTDHRSTRSLIDEVISHYEERVPMSALPPLLDRVEAVRHVFDSLAGFGPLQRFLEDPGVEEIWINQPGRVFIARHGRSELTTIVLSTDEVRDLVERMLKPSGRRLDLSMLAI